MSIIYEALRKTQRNREVRNMPARERVAVRNLDWLDKALLVFIISLLLFIVILYLPHLFKHTHAAPTTLAASIVPATAVVNMNTEAASVAPAPVTSVAAAPNNLFLNGVLLSDKEKLALINKKTFHVGDIVEGMKIIDIEIDSVRLDDNGRLVTLRTAS